MTAKATHKVVAPSWWMDWNSGSAWKTLCQQRQLEIENEYGKRRLYLRITVGIGSTPPPRRDVEVDSIMIEFLVVVSITVHR
jgi:hypothetical protein